MSTAVFPYPDSWVVQAGAGQRGLRESGMAQRRQAVAIPCGRSACRACCGVPGSPPSDGAVCSAHARSRWGAWLARDGRLPGSRQNPPMGQRMNVRAGGPVVSTGAYWCLPLIVARRRTPSAPGDKLPGAPLCTSSRRGLLSCLRRRALDLLEAIPAQHHRERAVRELRDVDVDCPRPLPQRAGMPGPLAVEALAGHGCAGAESADAESADGLPQRARQCTGWHGRSRPAR